MSCGIFENMASNNRTAIEARSGKRKLLIIDH